jgi:hypothetical protein
MPRFREFRNETTVRESSANVTRIAVAALMLTASSDGSIAASGGSSG